MTNGLMVEPGGTWVWAASASLLVATRCVLTSRRRVQPRAGSSDSPARAALAVVRSDNACRRSIHRLYAARGTIHAGDKAKLIYRRHSLHMIDDESLRRNLALFQSQANLQQRHLPRLQFRRGQ